MDFSMRINFVDVICDNSLRNIYANGQKIGYSFDIHLSYYRGLFLSCIEQFDIFVDGEKIDKSDITFILNDKEFNLFQISQCTTDFWKITDDATIEIFKSGGIKEGEYNIKVNLMLRIPYMIIPGKDGEDNYMPLDSCGEKNLKLNKEVKIYE